MVSPPCVILLVEDEPDLRGVIEELLGEEGYQVMGMADGSLALSWMEGGGRPSLVLLDFLMPRMNGWDFLERLRADPALRDVPVVAMSGSEVTHPLLSATLRKPFELSALIELVRRFVLAPG